MSKRVMLFDPTPEQRFCAIEHVVYEYANLMSAGHYSVHGAPPWRTQCDDAFLLGCRKLEYFLMRDKRLVVRGEEQDDVLALDYLPTNTRRTWHLPLWTSEWKQAMHKQLAHIAYARDKEWNHLKCVPQLAAEFRAAWWEFHNSIVNEKYKLEFDEQLAKCQQKPGFVGFALLNRGVSAP